MADLYNGFVWRIYVADLYGGFVWRILARKISMADLHGGFLVRRILVSGFWWGF